MPLSTKSNFPDPDAAYRLIVDAHRGLDEAESAAVQSATVLLLANHIADAQVLREALTLAREAVRAKAART